MAVVLQINIVVNSASTGRIAEEIGNTAIAHGWESYIAYGRGERPSRSELIKIGTNWDIKLHGIMTRLFDMHGLGSGNATVQLIEKIKYIRPDIIHLHNIHGYYLNYEVLFEFLSLANIPVIWTLHDCWPITGHCSHFEYIGCDKWESLCFDCPQIRSYPKSIWLDRSRKNYLLKKKLFNSVENLTLVPVSKWLARIYDQSFLSGHPIRIINNGIDLTVFSPAINRAQIRVKYGLGDSFVILGAATAWSNDKGLKEFEELSHNSEWKVVLVGIHDEIKSSLPKNIIALSRTENQKELAELYSAVDVFVNPTYEDTFPTTNLEALACGTPVVTYRTGGSPESVDEGTGLVVERGNVKELIAAIKQIKLKGKNHYSKSCIIRANLHYNKDDRFKEYIELYNSVL